MDRSGRGAAGGAVAGGPAGAVGPPVLPAGRQRGTPARAGAALAVLPAGARRVLLPLPAAARRRAPAVVAPAPLKKQPSRPTTLLHPTLKHFFNAFKHT